MVFVNFLIKLLSKRQREKFSEEFSQKNNDIEETLENLCKEETPCQKVD